MPQTLRILHLEDDPVDAELVAAALAADGLTCDIVTVATRAQFLAALDGTYDLILSDYSLPGFDGATAQSLAAARRPDLPFVFVSGTLGEEVAIERLKSGATDYVLKQRLPRLPSAVRRALDEARERRQRRQAERELSRLHSEVEERVAQRTTQLAAANAALARREAELAEAKSFLEHVVASSPSMIFRIEPRELRVTYVSPNVGWLLGYAPEELLGFAGGWENIIYADDRERVVNRLRDAMAGMVVQLEQEYRYCGKDGRDRWFFNLLRIDYGTDGAPVAILGYALDIADRKAAEEEVRRSNAFLDSIVENLPHMIFVKDAQQLRFVRLNRAGEDLMGLRRSEVLGRTDHDLLPHPVADSFVAQDRAVLDSRRILDIPEEILPMRNGAARIMHTKKIPIGDAAGRPQYVLGISEDITARRVAEEEIRLARLEAERANRAKSEFLSRMSHDLRTPLNAILGFAQILEMDVQTPHEADSVRQIVNGGMHLLDLINEILDIASIEAGRLSLSPESLNVDEMVNLVLDLMRPLADARNIEMRVDICDDVFVHADRQRLKQILVNLIGNAVKYNRPHGRVVISCAAIDDAVRISVADTGPGIAAEKIPLLFQPFERLGAESGPVEGTGLGLAVSKGLVEAMHGHLEVESREGAGATFRFELPRADAPQIAPPVSTTAAGGAAREGADVDGVILYIEDNLSNVRLLERLLTRRPGIRLVSAQSGEEGIAAVHRERPDLILLDLHLPDLSGEDVLGRLQADARTRGIPVAVLSADVVPGQAERLRSAGAVAYLSKPVDVARLLRLIDRRLVS